MTWPRLTDLLLGLVLTGCAAVGTATPSPEAGDASGTPHLASLPTPTTDGPNVETPEANEDGVVADVGSRPPPSVVGIQEYPVPSGSHPHDVAPAPDGTVWYTAQNDAALGRLDPATGGTHHIPLGFGSAPHGVIIGPDGAAWVTDSGLNAIVRVDPESEAVTVFSLPEGIVYYASLAGSHIARIDSASGEATVIEPATPNQGARRVWADSSGRIWVSEWDAGQLGKFDPATGAWQEWRPPGLNPQAYAVYVDELDFVWLSDFGANALVRFDPGTEQFEVFPLPSPGAAVRQILGRPGEIWGAESGVDKLVVLRFAAPAGSDPGGYGP